MIINKALYDSTIFKFQKWNVSEEKSQTEYNGFKYLNLEHV